MTDTVENVVLFFIGAPLAAIVSRNQLDEMTVATGVSILTGFFGGAAAIGGKMVVKAIVKKCNKDGERKEL